MKKISVYTRDGYSGSSSYYRILQYTSKIGATDDYRIKHRITVPEWLTKMLYSTSGGFFDLNIKLLYYSVIFFRTQLYFCLDLFYKPDCIIILRSITPKVFFPPLSWLYKKLISKTPVMWDFDDNIIESNEISLGEFNILNKNADRIIVTNSELLKLVCNKNNAVLLPTTDGDFCEYSFEKALRNRSFSYEKSISVVWVASSSNLVYLQKIMPALDFAAQILLNNYHKKLILKCICNKPVEYKCNYLVLENIIWTRHQAIVAIEQAHIGIMPLNDTKFTRGKGGFKIIQYMAYGVPAIASNVGYNNEIIDDKETGFLVDEVEFEAWYHSIIKLATDKELWTKMSHCAIKKWTTTYNYENALKKWIKLINEVMEEQ